MEAGESVAAEQDANKQNQNGARATPDPVPDRAQVGAGRETSSTGALVPDLPERLMAEGMLADGIAAGSTFRHAYSRDQATLIRRLRRIEGQVRGIERMIERREYCVDILQQTSALRAAVDSVALLILEDHVQGCVRTAAEQGDADKYIEEVLDVVRRSMGKPVRSRA